MVLYIPGILLTKNAPINHGWLAVPVQRSENQLFFILSRQFRCQPREYGRLPTKTYNVGVIRNLNLDKSCFQKPFLFHSSQQCAEGSGEEIISRELLKTQMYKVISARWLSLSRSHLQPSPKGEELQAVIRPCQVCKKSNIFKLISIKTSASSTEEQLQSII